MKARDLVDQVSAELHGWGISQDRITALAADIGPADLSFTVDEVFGPATGIQPGIVEIDTEQLYVSTLDQPTKTATIAAFGRGFGNSTAASHLAGARITSRPKFPRSTLLSEMNNIIRSVYPKLYSVKSDDTLRITYPSNSYTLPGNPEQILDVQWQDWLGRWRKVRSYQLDPFDHKLRLAGTGLIGRPLRVLWSERPVIFTSEDDDYSVCGLPESSVPVLTKGTAASQIPGVDISRAQASSVEQSDRSRVVPPNAGINAGKYLLAEYMQALSSETDALRRKYPPRIVRRF